MKRTVKAASKARTVKSFGLLKSGFCGFLFCDKCIAKKRINKFRKDKLISVCFACEANAIKVKLWEKFEKDMSSREMELSRKREAYKLQYKNKQSLENEVAMIKADMKAKQEQIRQRIEKKKEEENELLKELSDKKDCIISNNKNEQDNEKRIFELSNSQHEIQKRAIFVESETGRINKDNNINTNKNNKTKESLNDLIKSIRVKQNKINETLGDESTLRKSRQIPDKDSKAPDHDGYGYRCIVF